jgi:hypothetical protein
MRAPDLLTHNVMSSKQMEDNLRMEVSSRSLLGTTKLRMLSEYSLLSSHGIADKVASGESQGLGRLKGNILSG